MQTPDITPFLTLPARVIARYRPERAGDEDLIQDCLLAMQEAAPRWRGEAKLETYLYQVCRHTICHSDKSRESCTLSEIKHLPDEAAGEQLDTAALTAALSQLPEEQARAVQALMENDYKLTPAAKAAGMSPARFRRLLLAAAENL